MVKVVELYSVVQEVDDPCGVLHSEGVVHFSSAHNQVFELSDEALSSSDILFRDSVFLQQVWKIIYKLELDTRLRLE